MCVIIVNKADGKNISREEFRKAWKRNPDGGGIAYVKGGRVRIVKELVNEHKLWAAYKAIKKALPESNIIIHMRIATHGTVSTTNVHPFRVNRNLVFAHNGQITCVPKNTVYSDTHMFNTEVLQNLPKDFLQSSGIRLLLEDAIGQSKLAFLSSDNTVTILKERLGTWEDGNWYSNTFHRVTEAFNYTKFKDTFYICAEKKISPSGSTGYIQRGDYYNIYDVPSLDRLVTLIENNRGNIVLSKFDLKDNKYHDYDPEKLLNLGVVDNMVTSVLGTFWLCKVATKQGPVIRAMTEKEIAKLSAAFSKPDIIKTL